MSEVKALDKAEEKLIADTTSLARTIYGPNAKLHFRGGGAMPQWWVSASGGTEVLAAEKLLDLQKELTSRWPKGKVAPVVNGEGAAPPPEKKSRRGRLNSEQVGVLLGVSGSFVNAHARSGDLVGVQVPGIGRGGKSWRFTMTAVREFQRTAKYTKRREAIVHGAKKTAKAAKPKQDFSRMGKAGALKMQPEYRHLPNETKQRLSAFVKKYEALGATESRIIAQAVEHELDRLEKELG